MRAIKTVVDVMRGNLDEASRYLDRAENVREDNEILADWFVDMANAHLEFNSDGHKVAEKLVDDANAMSENNPLVSGMMVVYEKTHSDLARYANEVRARIAGFK